MGAKYSKSKEEKKVINITEYARYNKLVKLIKKWSPTIEFMMEKGEDWFVNVITYNKNSGRVIKDQMITEADIEEWVARFKRMSGYTKV